MLNNRVSTLLFIVALFILACKAVSNLIYMPLNAMYNKKKKAELKKYNKLLKNIRR